MSAGTVAKASGKPMASPSTCTRFTVCTEVVDKALGARPGPENACNNHNRSCHSARPGPIWCLHLPYPAKPT